MSASTPRRRRASGSAASTIRSTIALCSGGQDGIELDLAASTDYDDETLWNYELGVQSASRRGSASPPPPSTPTSATCRSPPTPAPARRASCSTCPRRTRWASSSSCPRGRSRASTCRSPAAARGGVRFRRTTAQAERSIAGHSRRQPAAVGAEVPARRPAPSTPSRSRRRRRGLCRRLLPACRHPLHPAERPGEQSAHLRLTACRSAARRRGRRPRSTSSCRTIRLVNLSAGVDWDNGLGVMVYVNNLFDENALLSLRPRARRPGAARLQRRPAADLRHHAAEALRPLIFLSLPLPGLREGKD